MQPEFWHERWRAGRIGFHRPAVDGNLLRHWPDLGVPVNARVFVPLCGKSLDLLWLQRQGHSVVGVELSDIALQSFWMENGIAARRRAHPGFDRYEAPQLELYRGDFFELTPSMIGEVAAVYDRAALVSWLPQLRTAYVDKVTSLTSPGTQTLLVTLEYPQSQMPGPPFSVEAAEVHRLYAPQHSIRELARRDALGTEDRMRERGVTAVAEVCYQITRL